MRAKYEIRLAEAGRKGPRHNWSRLAPASQIPPKPPGPASHNRKVSLRPAARNCSSATLLLWRPIVMEAHRAANAPFPASLCHEIAVKEIAALRSGQPVASPQIFLTRVRESF